MSNRKNLLAILIVLSILIVSAIVVFAITKDKVEAKSMVIQGCDHLYGKVDYVTDQGGGHVWFCYAENRDITGLLYDGTTVSGERSTFGVHHFVNGVCRDVVFNGVVCNYHCPHPSYSYGRCVKCGMECQHIGGTHQNGGRCQKCGFQYQLHNKSSIISMLIVDKTVHARSYKCTCFGCEETFSEPLTKHNWINGKCSVCDYVCTHEGGTHGNGGKCTICGSIYQKHGKSTTVARYETTETGHTPIYKCTFSNCSETYKGTTEAHNVINKKSNGNGTHTGSCSVCSKQVTEKCTYGSDNKCTQCGASKESSCTHSYQIDKTGATSSEHWEKCAKCGAKRNITKHTWKDGKCTVCSYVCKHTDTATKTDSKYHWKVCRVCGKEINKEEHSYKNGKCECGKDEPKTECKHANKELKYNTTEHWQVCKECGKEIPGTREKHTYKNGKCECGKDEPKTECKHTNRELKYNTTEHWQVCKECGKEIPGTREKHTYKNGVCTTCKVKDTTTPTNPDQPTDPTTPDNPNKPTNPEDPNKPSNPTDQTTQTECKHINREKKSNTTEHWEVCKDCGKEIPGTREKHTFKNGLCSNCGIKDSSEGKIPNTGIESMKIVLMITGAILGCALLIKLDREKE